MQRAIEVQACVRALGTPGAGQDGDHFRARRDLPEGDCPPLQGTLASRKTSRRCSCIDVVKCGKQSAPVLGRFCDTKGCECGSAVSTSALALTAPLPLFLPLGSPTGDDD